MAGDGTGRGVFVGRADERDGATKREIAEAIPMSSIARHWSALLSGLQVDEAAYPKDVDRLVRSAKKVAAASAPAGPSACVPRLARPQPRSRPGAGCMVSARQIGQ